MSKNQNVDGRERSQNQKNLMSEDPGDGARVTFDPESGKGEGIPSDKPDVQNQETIEAFGRRGAH